MAGYLASKNLNGAAGWMKMQAKEEMEHAMKFYHFIEDMGERVTLKEIQAPPAEWNSLLALMENVYAHEQKVTKLIHSLVDQARADNDHASFEMLQWFVKEQVEEELHARDLRDKIKLAGDSVNALFIIDGIMGKRAQG